ncbi:hypothetical protein D2H55_13290 [Vibrio parahaemolyticus]|nr:hypothetical protein [Vibrio parahaemolyticus]EGR5850779.1 hypothetical protein [Vibrio parahaemolyticus]
MLRFTSASISWVILSMVLIGLSFYLVAEIVAASNIPNGLNQS